MCEFNSVQQAESPAFFDQPPQMRRAQPVGLGFGKRLIEQILEPETRSGDCIGRAGEKFPEAFGEKALHNAP